MPHGCTQYESKQCKALSNGAEVFVHQAQKVSSLKETTQPALPNKSLSPVTILLYPDYKVGQLALWSLWSHFFFFQTQISSLPLSRILEEFCVISF